MIPGNKLSGALIRPYTSIFEPGSVYADVSQFVKPKDTARAGLARGGFQKTPRHSPEDGRQDRPVIEQAADAETEREPASQGHVSEPLRQIRHHGSCDSR